MTQDQAKRSTTGSVARRVALSSLTYIIRDGQSLSGVREHLYRKLEDSRDRAFAMQLVQGVLRWRWKLDALLSSCMDKPLRNKEHEVRHLLYIALYEIIELDTPEYAAVDEAVRLTRKLRKQWASKLVNAVLRRFIRQQASLLEQLEEKAQISHPDWLIDRIRHDWPDDWHEILEQNNHIAGTHLRVNSMRCDADTLQQRLQDAGVTCHRHRLDDDILVIDSTNVVELPGFEEGWFSVQDAGAQQLPSLIDIPKGARVLDLCAAPGGKACHLLETLDDEIALTAVDIDETRLARVAENLERLGLHADLLQADASTSGWLDDDPFDHIILDAPCSATGVIRRHPDIKSLRQPEDIAPLVTLQAGILDRAWAMLRPGGTLLYVTCSVLLEENEGQMSRFLSSHEDAEVRDLDVDWGRICEPGRQLLPGEYDSDGFYYALIRKTSSPDS